MSGTGRSIEILAYEETDLGPLCLRRRRTASEPSQLVTEITLNHAFLMSSLHTASECALSTIPLEMLVGDQLRVLIGGLGLGYTAHAALCSPRVVSVEVVEYLPPVIQWMHEGLIPLADQLRGDSRLAVRQGDILERLLSAPRDAPFDAILIDVDHSPEHSLSGDNQRFYTADGLRRASEHLSRDAILALWSYDSHTPLADAMGEVFSDIRVHPIVYYNQHVHEEFTDWLYVGRRR